MDYDDGDIAMFLDWVRPAEPRDEPDWKAFVRSLTKRMKQKWPAIFWYPDGSLDLQALAHFNASDAGTPPPDLFVYSGSPSQKAVINGLGQSSGQTVVERLESFCASPSSPGEFFSNPSVNVVQARCIPLVAEPVSARIYLLRMEVKACAFNSLHVDLLYIPVAAEALCRELFNKYRVPVTYLCRTANRSSPLVPSPYLIVDDVFKTASESQGEAVFEDYRLRDIRPLSEWWSARTKSHHAWAHLCKVVSDSNPQRIALKENMSHG